MNQPFFKTFVASSQQADMESIKNQRSIFAWLKQRILAIVIVSVVLAQPILAADFFQIRKESDTLKCAQNLSVYVSYMKKRMYDDALAPWRQLFFECPSSHVNIYSDGIKLMEHYLSKTTDEAARKAYVDTILLIYDQRMFFFGNHHRYPEGWIWGRKGIDILKYRGGDVAAMSQAMDCFNRSYQIQGNQVEPAVMFAWIQAARNLLNANQIKEDEFLKLYFRIKGFTENQLALETDSSKRIVYNQLGEFTERMVLESVRNRCEMVENYLKSSHPETSGNAELLQQTIQLMESLACVNTDYYLVLLDKTFEVNPCSDNAIRLARLSVRRNEFAKARDYYQKTLQLNNNMELVATANYELAVLEMSHFKNLSKALTLARMAKQLKPDWGLPYILIGNIYAQAANNFGDNEFEKQSVYWAAVDKFIEAMKADTAIANEASKYIETYSKYFPNRETAFFYGYQEGEQILIGSWINELTKVRFR